MPPNSSRRVAAALGLVIAFVLPFGASAESVPGTGVAGVTALSRIVLDEQGQPTLACGLADASALREFAPRLRSLAKVDGLELPTASKTSPTTLFEINYLDAPGTGFFDSTPVAPLPGNPATTLGGQRQAALRAAADVWAMRIDSALPLRVNASFVDLGCHGAASAGPSGWRSNASGMPLADTYYPDPVVVARGGRRIDSEPAELELRFNAEIGNLACFQGIVPDGFWYGIDRHAPSPLTAYSFLELASHEFGHGLGILGLLEDDGSMPNGFVHFDAFSRNLYSRSHQQRLDALPPTQRAAALAQRDDVVWDGTAVKKRLAEALGRPREVRATVAGAAMSWPAFSHEFLPFRSPLELSAGLRAARNATLQASTDALPRSVRDACEPLLDAPLPPDTVVMAEFGACSVDRKWHHAADAGAVALLMVDSREPEDPRSSTRVGLPLRERHDPMLWTVGPTAGSALWPLAESNTRIELGFQADAAPRGTFDGRLPLSDLGHFSDSTDLRLLMSRRSFGSGRFGFTDLTADALYDIGWPRPDARRSMYVGAWYQPARSGEGCVLSLEGNDVLFTLSCYFHHQGEQIWVLGAAELRGEALEFVPVQITRGTGYGSAFDPANVVRETFGRIRLSLSDCNRAVLDVWPERTGFGPFQVPLRKIVQGDCQTLSSALPDRSLSGSYYDPARSGEGIQIAVEADGRLASLAWYTYDAGRQLWAIGAGPLVDARLEVSNAVIAQGGEFGRDFNPTDVRTQPFGAFELQWIDCNRVDVRIQPTAPGLEPSQRILRRVVPREC